MSNGNTVSVTVKNGPTTSVPWTQGMTALQALEGAWTALNTGPVQFNYAVQYYGSLGYWLVMMNNTTDSPFADPPIWPSYFWAYLLNGAVQFVGLDQSVLNDGDELSFEFQFLNLSSNNGSQNADLVRAFNARNPSHAVAA